MITIIMSLDDRFNPNDGSFIDRVDNSLRELHKKMGYSWQNRTYKSVKVLKRGFYATTAIALGAHCVMTPSNSKYFTWITALAGGICATFGVGGCPKTSLESEIQSEAMGLHAKSWKYINVGIYGLGLIHTTESTIQIVAGVISGNNEWVQEGLNNISYGIGVLSWATANYLHLTDFDPPPPKPKKKPVLEKIKDDLEELLPNPLPEPIPVRNSS